MAALGAGAAAAQGSEASSPLPPHIVLVIADDLGWTDLSTGRTNRGNGSPYYQTPALDRLAALGTCFVNAYSNGPNCAPTRAALWSGKWSMRTGIYTVSGGNRGRARFRKLDAVRNETVLRPEFVTLAERLRSAGYATGHFGKWHLGGGKDGASPTHQGFDHQAGGNRRGGVGSMGNFADGEGAFALPGLDANGVANQFLADRLTDEAIEWIAGVQQPIFCCVSHYSVHTPIQAPDADLAATPAPATSEQLHRNRRYAAMLKNLDANVARLEAHLRKTDDPLRPGEKLWANTLLIFTSDNGGLGGYRDAGVAGGQEVTHQAPLRSGKGSLHEGGIRVPFFAVWPGRVRAGAVDETPLQTFDLHATLTAIAAANVDDGRAERDEIVPSDCDAADLSGRLQLIPAEVTERALFWHFPGYLAANGKLGTWRTTPGSVVRHGDWKAIYWYETRTWSLYNLAEDLGEDTDLVTQRPEQLRRLAAMLRKWLEATKAPMPRTLEGVAVALPVVPG